MDYAFPTIWIAKYAGMMTVVLGVLLLLGIAFGRESPLNYIFAAIVCIATGLFVVLWISKGGTLKIENQKLTLKIPMYKTKIITTNEIAEVRIVEIDSESPYRPARKRSGTATKAFKSGWFTLKNKEKAFVALEGQKALYIKTQNGALLLIGIKDFDRLLTVFNKQIYQTL